MNLGYLPYDVEGCESVIGHYINSSIRDSIDFLLQLLNEEIKVMGQKWLLFQECGIGKCMRQKLPKASVICLVGAYERTQGLIVHLMQERAIRYQQYSPGGRQFGKSLGLWLAPFCLLSNYRYLVQLLVSSSWLRF